MALAIAYYIRPQQSMKVEHKQDIELIQKSIAVEFGFEKEQKDERYSKVVVF